MFGILLLILCVLLIYIYFNEKKKANYWRSKGVAQIEHAPILGILWSYLTIQKGHTLGHLFQEMYQKFKDQPYVGCFTGVHPNLVLVTPEMFHHVLRSHYTTFSSRGVSLSEQDILSDNVLFMEGVRWKLTRQKLTPVFTSVKLKNMFYILHESSKKFPQFLKEFSSKSNSDPMDLLSAFTMSTISASVFGIEAKVSDHFDSQLRRMANDGNNPSLRGSLFLYATSLLPTLLKKVEFKMFKEHETFFVDLVKRMLKARRESGAVRHDFIDNCLEIQKEEYLRDPETNYSLKTTDEFMAGQAFFFFIAGVDPTATAINFSLYELSQHPDILEALHNEIDTFYRDDLTIEIVEKMELLEKVLCEAMRKYPPIPNMQRVCVQDHELPDGLVIEKNTILTIPVLGVHKDERYYPDPETFDPERFTAEAIRNRPNLTYMPFGEGNRMCIGFRFAKLQAKTGLIHILRDYTVQKTSSEPVQYVKSFFSLRSLKINYKFIPRNKNK